MRTPQSRRIRDNGPLTYAMQGRANAGIAFQLRIHYVETRFGIGFILLNTPTDIPQGIKVGGQQQNLCHTGHEVWLIGDLLYVTYQGDTYPILRATEINIDLSEGKLEFPRYLPAEYGNGDLYMPRNPVHRQSLQLAY